jgi:hypothetical protein
LLRFVMILPVASMPWPADRRSEMAEIRVRNWYGKPPAIRAAREVEPTLRVVPQRRPIGTAGVGLPRLVGAWKSWRYAPDMVSMRRNHFGSPIPASTLPINRTAAFRASG